MIITPDPESGSAPRYTKLRKIRVKSGAKRTPGSPTTKGFTQYASEVAPASAGVSSLTAGIIGTIAVLAFTIAAAAITMGTLGFIDARNNNKLENVTNEIFINTTNNYTVFECCNATNSTGGSGVNVTAGPGINVTYLNADNALIWNTGIYDIEAGPGVTIDKSDPHVPIISATGGGSSNTSSTSCITSFYVNVTAADLNAGVVTLFAGSTSQYIEIIYLYQNYSVDFDSGGDRDVNVYGNFGNDISQPKTFASADMKDIYNAFFAGGPFYYIIFDSLTIPSVPVTAVYSGGTTDYTSGTLSFIVILVDVTNNCSSSGGGSSSGIQSIIPGTGIAVDNTDPQNPIVSATSGGTSNITTTPLFTIIDVDVTYADISPTVPFDLFTPQGNDVYLMVWSGIVIDQSTDFDSSGDYNTYIEFATPDSTSTLVFVSSNNLRVLSVLTPNLYPVQQSIQTYLNQVGNTIRLSTENDGTTMYTSGSMRVRMYMLNTNAMAIGGNDGIVYVKDISITAAALASGGQVTILNNADPAGQYEVITAYTATGTPFSGGGNRFLKITDGTNVFGIFNPQGLAVTSLPMTYGNNDVSDAYILIPDTNSISTPTAPGANIYAEYLAGSIDYAAGEIILSMVLRKIAGNNAVGVQAIIPGTGISVDSSNPQYPIVSATGGGSSLTSTLKANGAVGDVFFLSEQATGLGLYPSPNFVFDFAETATSAQSTANYDTYGVIADSAGNIYSMGYCYSGTVTFGSTTLTCSGSTDIFITASDSTGTYLWALQTDTTVDGSSTSLSGPGIGVDNSGNLYVSGSFSGNVTFGVTMLYSPSTYAFVAKIDPTGPSWTWIASSEGADFSFGYTSRTTASGTTCLALDYGSEAIFGTFTITGESTNNAGYACIDSTGTWISALGVTASSSDNQAESIAIDSTDQIYISGSFKNTVTFGTTTLTASTSSTNAFLAKSDSAGLTWTWAVQITTPDSGYSDMTGVQVDDSDDPYTTGRCNGPCTLGSTTLDFGSINTFFVTKNNHTDGSFTFVSHSTLSSTNSISTQPGNIDIYGTTIYASLIAQSAGGLVTSINIGGTTFSLPADGTSVPIVAALSTTDGSFLWATKIGYIGFGAGSISLYGISVDSNGNIYVCGIFSTMIVVGNTYLNALVSGNDNGFVARIPFYGKTLNTVVMLSEAGSSGATVSYVLSGSVTGSSGLAPGKPYYYDAATGQTVAYYTAQYVGYAASAAAMVFSPQPAFVPVP